MDNKKKILLSVLGVVLIIIATVGVTFAFFNYTRTGRANTIQVGRISFTTSQDTFELTNVFPTSSTNLNSSNSDTVTITITGDTTYDDGIEYKVTLEDVSNAINGKTIPISFNTTVTDLGDKETDYYTERGGEDAIYNVTETGQVEDGKYILVGYIPKGATGVDGSIDITAYIDASNVAISDTVSTIENGNLIYGETPGDWIAGREVFTTTEWNSLTGNNAVSFKVKVEANEGIWIEQEQFYVLKNLNDIQAWKNVRANITSIEFHKDGIAPANPVATIDATDVISKGAVTLYTVDDGLGNNTYKAIVVADDVIYAPENSSSLFSNMSNLVIFNSENFKVDNVTNMMMMFRSCTSLINVNSLSSWNTSKVTGTGMICLFQHCSSLENVDGLINFDITSLTNFTMMFNNCTNLTNVNGLINWNVSNVTVMYYTFLGCSTLTNINALANWNTSNMMSMEGVFKGCSSLTNINALANWNTSSVTNMQEMFSNGPIITSYQVFRKWNVGKVKNFQEMFNAPNDSSSTVTTLSGLENWNVSSATNMIQMFNDHVSLTDASAINNWNINASIDFTEMFHNCASVHPEFTKVAGTWDNEGTFTPNAS